MRTRNTWIAAALWLAVAALPARGQEPKAGDYYTDDTDLGFKVRVPQKWDPIPPSPDDGNLIIKYDPRANKVVQIGKSETMDLHVWILKFDRRKVPADAGGPKPQVMKAKDLAEWLKFNGLKGFDAIDATKKESKIAKVPATECVYEDTTLSDEGSSVRLYAATFQIQPEVEVALVGWGPGDTKRWSKFESAFKEMARSFKTVEIKRDKSLAMEGASLRDRKRADLADKLRRTPGWKLYETPNYFIVSSNQDKAFLDELMGRLEAIRAVYEQDYPSEKVKAIREAAALSKTSSASAGRPDEKGEEEDEDDPEEPATRPEDLQAIQTPWEESLELSRCSVVRVCKSADEYHSFGGPGNAAGHWDSNAQELVVYDDRAIGGKGNTWITLNHEAFHQYIYYFYGNINPHSWYNEGTGDFYSGYIYKNGRFTLEKNPWRKETIKEAIRNSTDVPLSEFLRASKKDYYTGNSKWSSFADGRQNYAQGWSLIYFLRTGKKNNAKGWDPKWDSLLEDYMRVLASTGKPKQAIEQCLTGIDMAALEAAWREYTK